MLVVDAKVGDTIEIECRQHGWTGAIKVIHKYGRQMKLAFDFPKTTLIRVMDHRAHGITWGLTAEPTAPLKHVALG